MDRVDVVKKLELEGFSKDRVARFVITDHFKEDFVSDALDKVTKNMGNNFFLYSAYEHKEDYTCICEKKVVKQNSVYLTLSVLQPHKHYLIWYKEQLDSIRLDVLQMNESKDRKKWIGWLFNLEQRVGRPSWMRFRQTRTNALKWTQEYETYGLIGV